MKLIFLYGPPASGKYTVAKILAEKTGYKLFHNHLTIDLLTPIFEFGTYNFFKLNNQIRLKIFEEAARQKLPGLIFTYVYEKGDDDEFIKEVVDRVTKNDGKVIFIQIYCEKKELLRRVKDKERRKFQKINKEEPLIKLLNRGDFMSPISFYKSTRIDNTKLSVEKTLEKVLEAIK